MKWIKRMLGILDPLERKKAELADLQEKAFNAQRNGDLRLAGKYLLEADRLENEILDLMEGES